MRRTIRLPRGKFIPSFAVKYAGSEGWPDLEDAAKFDLIITGAGSARPKAHPSLAGNTWQVLKRLNPAQIILLYELGPGEYNTADWGRLGPGWEWLRREHGPGTADRWTAVGAKFGECLQGVDYANERLMLVGNPNWQQFWLDQVYAKHWGQPYAPTILANGVFADNTRYTIPWLRWIREGHPETLDSPADYSVDGQYQPDIYRRQMKEFLARALPWMAARQRTVGINFSGMAGPIAEPTGRNWIRSCRPWWWRWRKAHSSILGAGPKTVSSSIRKTNGCSRSKSSATFGTFAPP